jgi:hypothetical protein
MIRKSGHHFSDEIMLKLLSWRMILPPNRFPLRRIMR